MNALVKKILAICFVLVLLLLAILPVATASARVQDFVIQSFEADYYVGRDENNVSTMRVVEKIVAVFPDINQNRGILRAIPDEYKGNSLKLNIESVVNEYGKKYEFSSSNQNDNKVLKIGDPDRYVHGATTYVITYTMKGVISFEDNHDELYWDVNGDQWPQAFGSVTARIHIPRDLTNTLQERQLCFAGSFRANSNTCTISRSTEADGSVLVTAQANRLSGYQTLTYVLAFNDGTFQPYVPSLLERIWPLLFISPAIIVPLLTTLYVYIKWRKYGRDPSGKGVIVPEYAPPKGFNALRSSVVLDEKMQNKAISAQLIDLAVRGYVALHEIEKKGLRTKRDYELELLKPSTRKDSLTKEEQDVLSMFFGSYTAVGTKVKLADLKTKLHTKVASLSTYMSEVMFEQGYFITNPDKARRTGIGKAILAFIVGFVLMYTIVGIPLGIGLIISGVILIVAGRAMPARSLQGVHARDHLLGLRDYMKLAEADRIKFLQSPEGVKQYGDITKPENKIKLFEKLLPYAMLFGIEKGWAKEFQDLYAQPPDWYHGNWSTFNTVYLANSLGGFSTASGASFTAPSSSGSSGFSGGGGGFSGGGGGGGGGGGW